MTPDIVAFIRARLDEQTQQCSQGHRPGECHPNCGHVCELRGVDAKRRVLALHFKDDFGPHECVDRDDHEAYCCFELICPTMLILATEWSDHPDYRQEWMA